jgi:hypothetical protein
VKHLKQHWSAQPVSFLLSVLMVLPVLALFLLRAPAAQAQGLASPQPTWAVLDFANPSGYGGTDVGRLASDSFVVELAKLNRYAVLPRQDLLNGIQANNLTPPLNLTSIERLGQALGVQAVVAGEIASISFSRDRRQAKVNLVVRVFDPRSGFLLNGALAEGYSNQRPIPVTDEEQLVNEAFGNAAFNAVRQISKFNLPVATVLIGRDTKSVTLNKGTRDGLYDGLEMIVTRNGVVTGRVRIFNATNNDSDAIISDQGQGIRPEDRATALYKLPEYSIDTNHTIRTASAAQVGADTASTGPHRSAFSGVGGILVALLAAGLLLSAIRAGHKDASLGGANVSGAHAISGRASDLGGSLSAAPTVGSIISNYIPVAVRITADTGNVDPTNFLEFHVYRSDSPAFLNSYASLPTFTARETTIFTFSNTNNGGNGGNNGGNTNGVVIGGILGLSGFGQVPILAQAGHNNLTIFDDFNGKQSVTASKPDPSDSGTLVTLTGAGLGFIFGTNTAGNNNGTTTTTITAVPIPGTGLQFGQRVFYQVEGLYIQPSTFNSGNSGATVNPGTTGNNGQNTNNSGGGTNTGGGVGGGGGGGNNGGGNNGQNTSGTTTQGHSETFQLTGRRNTNFVTYIEPVHPFGNSVTGTGATNVNVTVPSTRGANDYILQISTDPGFSNSHTYRAAPGAYNATLADPTNQAAGSATGISTANGTAVVFNNINLSTDFPNGTVFFYRVGARNSADNGQDGFDNPYVFSDPLALNITGAAPALQSRLRSHNFGNFGGRSRN